MAYVESKDDVIDDVTWSWKVTVVTPIYLGAIISKTARDRLGYNGAPIGNCVVASYNHVTDDATDPERLTSWPS